MFYFRGTRKPDFQHSQPFDYQTYWEQRGFQLRSKLMEREQIFWRWIPPHSRVLDVGCGNSRLLYELKTQKSCQVFALDISANVIASLGHMGIPGRVADLEREDFADLRNFDSIIISEVLEHLKYPEALLQQMKLVGKFFVISVPNSAFYRYRLHLMFTGRFFTQWAFHPAEHLRYWSHKDFLEWLAAQGVRLVKFKAASGFEFKDLWPNLLCATGCYLVEVAR